MNKTHEVRFCRIDEFKLLIEFIDTHWKKNHILTKSKELLNWQYLNKKENQYNFVIAYNTINNKFDAILGFIPTSKFDSTLENSLCLSIWKVIENNKEVSGMQLLMYLQNKLKPKNIIAIGLSQNVIPIYKALKYTVNKLNHYYIQSNEITPQIATFNKKNPTKTSSNLFSLELLPFDYDFSRILNNENSMEKSLEYFQNRYFSHPFYKYKIVGIFKKNKLYSIFIYRKIQIKNSECLRIVDFQGEIVKDSIYSCMQEILKKENAEYIDFLTNLDYLGMNKMGFIKKDEGEIIPEYFEPFVEENVDIYYAYKGTNYLSLFKGDSDQDRPNVLRYDNE